MLENKVVNVEKPEFIQFFYPEYQIREELNFRDVNNKIIYVGKMRNNLDNFLREHTKSYISTIGKVDVNLDDEYELLEFVYSKYGKRVTKKVKRTVDMMDEEDFIYCIKTFWLTGEWVYYLEDEELSMFDLFLSTTKSTIEMLETYFNLLDKYPYYMVESSFFTFLQRSRDYEEQDVSDGYKRLLHNFNDKSGSVLKSSIIKYMKKGEMEDRLRFLSLLLSLR
jgi:hypothetical protein